MGQNILYQNQLKLIVDFILEQMPTAGERETLLAGFQFIRRDDPKFCCQKIAKPMAALVCQGSKFIKRGEKEEVANSGEIIITSVEVPDFFGVLNVEAEKPYLSIAFQLERKIFVELLGLMPWQPALDAAESSFNQIVPASPAYLETILRAARISLDPIDASILGPLLLRELHYLLLKGPAGASLRHLYMRGSNDNRIIEAINYLKKNLGRPVSMEELARTVYMSVSSLHRHFRKVTGFSPLQYHKELRLYEAQRLMLADNERADAAAQAVGYESVTQFNREYKRKFGLPPHQDIRAIRAKISGNLDSKHS